MASLQLNRQGSELAEVRSRLSSIEAHYRRLTLQYEQESSIQDQKSHPPSQLSAPRRCKEG